MRSVDGDDARDGNGGTSVCATSCLDAEAGLAPVTAFGVISVCVAD